MVESNQADISRIYRSLRLIRRTEEEIARIYPTDKIKSPVHLSIGQESIAVGVCEALESDDVTTMSYRCHATYLAKGGDLNSMMAELYGKETGCGRGKAGSMHLVDMSHQVLGASAVVATTIPIAVGYALAMKREGKGRITAAFFGDGATEEGVFTESLNFAALKRLPILFVMEDNDFAIHAPRKNRWASDAILDRVRTYGIPANSVEDGDVLKIHEAAARAIADMREGGGPVFLACKIYRWREHVGPAEDFDAGYRRREEMQPWLDLDQVEAIGKKLPAADRARIDAAVEADIAAAIEFAEQSPFPGVQQLHDHLYAD